MRTDSTLPAVVIGTALMVAVVLGLSIPKWMPDAKATTWVTAGTNLTANVVSAASIGSTTSNAVALPYADTTGITSENLRVRFVQNVGTVPLLYCLGGTASVTNFHGVLAAGTAARDGLGSVVDLRNWRGSVSVAVESGTGNWVAVEVVK